MDVYGLGIVREDRIGNGIRIVKGENAVDDVERVGVGAVLDDVVESLFGGAEEGAVGDAVGTRS